MSSDPTSGKTLIKGGEIQVVTGCLMFAWLLLWHTHFMKIAPGKSLNFVGQGLIVIGLLLVTFGAINLVKGLRADRSTAK